MHSFHLFRRARLALAVASLSAVLLAIPSTAAPRTALTPRLDNDGSGWLQIAAPWMTAEEARLYLELTDSLHREHFQHRFWAQRPPREVERFHGNQLEADERFTSEEDQRRPAMVLAGKPSRITRLASCAGVLRPLEIWYFDPQQIDYQIGWQGDSGTMLPASSVHPDSGLPLSSPLSPPLNPSASPSLGPSVSEDRWSRGARGELYLLFYQQRVDTHRWRWWSPRDGIAPLLYEQRGEPPQSIDGLLLLARRYRCAFDDSARLDALDSALRQGRGRETAIQHLIPPAAAAPALSIDQEEAQPEAQNEAANASSHWTDTFRQQLRSDTLGPLAPPIQVSAPGRFQSSTLVRLDLEVADRSLRRTHRGHLYDRLEVIGDIRRQSRLVDSFRIVFYLAGEAPTDGGRLPLSIFRQLRPGPYTATIRVQDSRGLALLRQDLSLAVPSAEEPAPPPAGVRLGYSALTRAEVGRLTTFPRVELRDPGPQPLAGLVEVEATTSGGPIDRLRFLLDGQLIGSDDEPPFTIAVPLEAEPRRHRLEVEALDSAGLPLARHGLWLNDGPGRFAVRLLSPSSDGWSATLEARVDVPLDRPLRRIVVSLDGRPLHTLREPPPLGSALRLELPAERPTGARWLQLRAELEDGTTAEDVVYVGIAAADQVDVDLIQLWTTVTDADGRFITGLEASEFRVLDGGHPTSLERFQSVETLPLDVAVLMDLSTSMRRRLEIASESVEHFFTTTVRSGDRASFTTFHHDIRQRVPFTDDKAALRYGASALRAWGSTRLYDALLYTLAGFDGMEGRRALVVLSDGRDVDSDFGAKQVLEAARRARVAIYPILLTVDDEETRTVFEEVARRTGGRIFTVRKAEQLDRVYRLIELELRSQYLLVLRAGDGGDFRPVSVEVGRPGLVARTTAGYYP